MVGRGFLCLVNRSVGQPVNLLTKSNLLTNGLTGWPRTLTLWSTISSWRVCYNRNNIVYMDSWKLEIALSAIQTGPFWDLSFKYANSYRAQKGSPVPGLQLHNHFRWSWEPQWGREAGLTVVVAAGNGGVHNPPPPPTFTGHPPRPPSRHFFF